MTPDLPLQHIDQYFALPDLMIPAVGGSVASGRVYCVLGVDFYVALKSDCLERGIEAFEIPGLYRCALPTVAVQEGVEIHLYRLPNSLAEWVYELMRDQPESGKFPASVEFGLHRDEYFARFLPASGVLDLNWD